MFILKRFNLRVFLEALLLGLLNIFISSCLTGSVSVGILPTPSGLPSSAQTASTLLPLAITSVTCPSPVSGSCTQTSSTTVSIPQSVSSTVILNGSGFNTGTSILIGGVPCTPPSPYFYTNSQY